MRQFFLPTAEFQIGKTGGKDNDDGLNGTEGKGVSDVTR